jgi:hypothetical protein
VNDDWWEAMRCWNGLSDGQKFRLIQVGNLPFGYQPQGPCPNPAEIGIETIDDEAPGPRFYCQPCAIDYLAQLTLTDAAARRRSHRREVK